MAELGLNGLGGLTYFYFKLLLQVEIIVFFLWANGWPFPRLYFFVYVCVCGGGRGLFSKSWTACGRHRSRITVDPAAPCWQPRSSVLLPPLLFLWSLLDVESWVGRILWDLGCVFPRTSSSSVSPWAWGRLTWRPLSWWEMAQQCQGQTACWPSLERGTLRWMTACVSFESGGIRRGGCVCVRPCAWTHSYAHPRHLKSLFPLVSSGTAGLVMSAVPAPLWWKGSDYAFCWCLCLIAGCKNYKFSLAETFLNKRFLLSQLLSFRLCTPTPTAAVAQGHLGF